MGRPCQAEASIQSGFDELIQRRAQAEVRRAQAEG
jgi:hypothetical protein